MGSSSKATPKLEKVSRRRGESGSPLRKCVRRYLYGFQTLEHKMDHSQLDYCLTRLCPPFVVAGQPAAGDQPGERPLHDPALFWTTKPFWPAGLRTSSRTQL